MRGVSCLDCEKGTHQGVNSVRLGIIASQICFESGCFFTINLNMLLAESFKLRTLFRS